MSDPRVMGYARVSSTGQNLARQILELRKYVPEENIIVLCGSIPRIIQHLPIWICRTTCLIIWICRCAESACPVFWKSPVRIEEITIPEVIIAAEPPSRRR